MLQRHAAQFVPADNAGRLQVVIRDRVREGLVHRLPGDDSLEAALLVHHRQAEVRRAVKHPLQLP